MTGHGDLFHETSSRLEEAQDAGDGERLEVLGEITLRLESELDDISTTAEAALRDTERPAAAGPAEQG